MKLRFKFSLAVLLTVSTLASLPSSSQANVIRTFDLSGEFVIPTPSGPQDFRPLTGTVTIDTTLGTVLSQTSFSPIAPSLPIVLSQGVSLSAQSYFLTIFGQIFTSTLYFNTGSLVDYAGGNLGSTAHPTVGGKESTYDAQLLPTNIVLATGSATLAPVPEPASMTLLAAGFGSLALAGLFRRSRR